MDIGIPRQSLVYSSNRLKRLALLLTLPTFTCLLAVLIFTPKVSFATTVQGTTVYSSSAEAQTQINTLITVAIAAHPGATQNGNAVQWVADGRSVTRAWTIRAGLSTISKFTLRYLGGGEDVYAAPRFDFTLIGYNGFAALRNQALGIVPSILYNRPDDPNVVGDNSQLSNNPHAEPEDVYIGYDVYIGGVLRTTRMVINYGASSAVITPYYIDYQDTGSQLCPIPGLTRLTDPIAIDFDNNPGGRWRPDGLSPDYQVKLTCVTDGIDAATGRTRSYTGTSAYRPAQYQRHLYEIITKDVELDSKYMTANPECQALRDKITKKMKDHELKYDQKVAIPGSSRHEAVPATAFDLTPIGLTKAQMAPIYARCGVSNTVVRNEPWHTQ